MTLGSLFFQTPCDEVSNLDDEQAERYGTGKS